MSDLPQAPAPSAAPAAPVDGANVVTSVVETVQSHPDVPPARAAAVIASILAGLYQAEPAIFAATRASARTQVGVTLGLGLAEAIVGALVRKRA